MQPAAIGNDAPIGIFDSGIGGLSVLRHIRQQLPHENLIYFADSGYAPYGDKPLQAVIERTMAVAAFLLQHRCKALVIACNTATAAAVHLLRERYPDLPIVGVEPGLKPAAIASKTRQVGVLATDRTIASAKFHALHDQLAVSTGVHFHSQACNGLADLIERGELDSDATRVLVRQYVAPLATHDIDTLVLGCTHYPFVQSVIEAEALAAGLPPLTIIDTGEPVARQLSRLLLQHDLANPSPLDGHLKAYSTGLPQTLASAFKNLLQRHPPIEKIAV